MELTYNVQKNAMNVALRKLSFERVVDFDFESALFLVDNRWQYGEVRHIAIGYLDRRLHVLCFTATETGIRVISLRKANLREGRKYEKPLTID